MAETIDVFVICSAGTVAPGQAKAFMLSRIDEAGESRPFPIFIMHDGQERLYRLRQRLPPQRKPPQ